MNRLQNFITTHRLPVVYLLIGIALRLIYNFLFNHLIDITWHLAFARSVAETGNLTEGFLAVLRAGDESQLHGKIWYQLIALWLHFLNFVKIIKLELLLDTRPFTETFTYLIGFRQWSPPLYQLISIKLIQFVWDIPLAIYLYLTAKELGVKKPHYILLFWAVNPYLMMVGYAIMMTEIAMLTAFVAGCYYWIKALRSTQKNNYYIFGILTAVLLALGAVIKQTPLLLIPFAILSLTKNIRTFLIFSIAAGCSYLLLRQPWAPDAILVKKYFFLSPQSTGIFKFTFNRVPYFLLFYGLLFFIVSLNRKIISANVHNIFKLVTVILCLIYITDTVFFVQFVTWILPFAGLIALSDAKNLWILFSTLLAVTLKTLHSGDYFSTLLSPTIGSRYSNYLNNSVLINKYFSYQLYDSLLHTIIIILFIITAVSLITQLFNKTDRLGELIQEKIKKFDYKKIVWIFFFLYLFFIIADYVVKSPYISLPQQQFQISDREVKVTRDPLLIRVNNPQKYSINAIQLSTIRKAFPYDEHTVFRFSKNGRELFTQKVHDFEFPTKSDDLFTIFLDKPIKEKQFDVAIYKEKGINEIIFYEAKQISELSVPGNKLYVGYDTPQGNEVLDVQFADQIFPFYLRGSYGINDIIKGLRSHFTGKAKTIFYGSYFLSIILLLLLSYVISRMKSNSLNQD